MSANTQTFQFQAEARQVLDLMIHSLYTNKDIFLRELDMAYEEGGLFQLTMHPHIIGYRSRIFIVEELIRHAKSRRDVWFATHREVAEWAKAHAQ